MSARLQQLVRTMGSQVPSTMNAIIINGNKASVSKIPVPKLRPTYVLCKVNSVALNPTDWKHINGKRAAENSISGCDFAGTVVEIGPEVTKSLKPGDRVAGVCHGGNFSNIEDGAFAEYCMAKGDVLVKIPDSLSFEDASTFPLGFSTVGQGLFQQVCYSSLQLQLTFETHTDLMCSALIGTEVESPYEPDQERRDCPHLRQCPHSSVFTLSHADCSLRVDPLQPGH